MCYLCGQRPDKLSRDHVIPKSLVPKQKRCVFYNKAGMIKWCCKECNRMKANLELPDFISRARKIVEYQYTQLLQEAA